VAGGSVERATADWEGEINGSDRGISDGVKVNAINPGTIETERLKARIAKFAADRKISEDVAASEMATKLGVSRFGTPEEIAFADAFLASDWSSYCQGTIMDVDGGQTRTL
jgi:3-oxoacyl-[acyl-carrier protein] reductase